MNDEQIIERCKAAGIKWIPPQEDEDDSGAFPGMFDMVTMSEMRALLAASASAEPATIDVETIQQLSYKQGFNEGRRIGREESARPIEAPDNSKPVIADVKDRSEMKSKGIGKWTITKPTNDGSGGYTTYETSDVAEVREAGRRGWGISQHIEVDFEDDPTIDDRSLEEAAVVGYLSETKATKPGTVTDEMVSRFLAWKLPKDFCPDCYIAFDREKASQGSWPIGTNLLHAEQARAMLEHVIAAPAIDAEPDNTRRSEE